MALGRITVFVPGTVALAGAVNGEFNNILNNPIALISPTTGAINFNLQPHLNLLPASISASSGNATDVLAITAGVAGWTAQSALNPAVGSRVMGLSGTISSQSGGFTAEYYLMRTTAIGSHSFNVVATSSFSANIGSAGPTAGGRDVAGSFSSTEVHWYAISTGANSTAPAGLVSTQKPPTGPVMPANYSAWAYLGASPYTSASTTVLNDHYFGGAQAYYSPFMPTSVVSTNPIAETTLILSSQIPSNAVSMRLRVGVSQTPSGTIFDPIHIRVASSQDIWTGRITNTTTTVVTYSPIDVPNVGQRIIYQSASSAGANAPAIFIDVMGWRNPIGSE